MLVESAERVVVIVDDDEVFRTRLGRAFSERAWQALAVASGEEALPLIEEREPDLVLVDLRLANGSGLDVVSQIKQKDSTATVIMLTGYGSIATALTATKLGADDYVSKPADVDQILGAFEKVAHQQQRDRPAEELPMAASLARVEWEHIQRVLADCDGNISKAARVLGIHRRSLQRKLDRYPPNH